MQNEPQDPESIYARAVALIANEAKASTSFVQRRFSIGYVRASELILRMQAEGIISEPDHVGRMTVHILPGESLENWRMKRLRTNPKPPPETGGYPLNDHEQDEENNSTMYKPVAPGTNMVSGDELRSFLERLERFDREIAEKKDGRKEVMAEAKGRGYGTKYLAALVELRKKKPSEREEDEAMMQLYGAAVGMSNELPLFRHVQGMGVDVTSKEAVIEALKLLAPMDGELTIKVGAGLRMRISRNRDGVTVEEMSDMVVLPAAHAPASSPDLTDDAPDVDEDGAFDLGREARKDDKAVIANPFKWDDARRRRWDEGWRDQDGGDGMGPR